VSSDNAFHCRPQSITRTLALVLYDKCKQISSKSTCVSLKLQRSGPGRLFYCSCPKCGGEPTIVPKRTYYRHKKEYSEVAEHLDEFLAANQVIGDAAAAAIAPDPDEDSDKDYDVHDEVADDPGDVHEQQRPADRENAEQDFEPDAEDDFDDMYVDYPLPDIPHDNLPVPAVELPQVVQETDIGSDTEMPEVCLIYLSPISMLICT
jgi:hypothetical protein